MTKIIRKQKMEIFYQGSLEEIQEVLGSSLHGLFRFFRVVYENKMVFADEVDRVLNPILAERMIAFINGKDHKGQFVFSSHNVLHLDLKKLYERTDLFLLQKS